MSGVKTGELLSFQDYSPEHNNDRSARIDVEAVHTNQYMNPSGNPGYNNYEEPELDAETPEQPQSNHNFWTIEYYQKYFDVQTNEVLERIISSMVPTKVSSNYFDDRINSKPDLYGPIWISVTLIFTIAVSGNISSYLQSANATSHQWRYDFHLVSYAASAICSYVWLVPVALWVALKSTIHETQDQEAIQGSSNTPSMMSLFCLYGYSLSIYIPVAILWTIQVSWLQWLLVLMAAFISGAVLIYWLLSTLRKSKYFIIIVGSILALHFLLAAGFMLYFFHVPTTSEDVVPKIIATTVVSETGVAPPPPGARLALRAASLRKNGARAEGKQEANDDTATACIFVSSTSRARRVEKGSSNTPSMMSLFCLYGYSLSIYIPVAVLWTIQVSWLQWLLVLMAAFISGAVLIYWLLSTLRKSKYFIIIVGSILALHFLLAAGFMLYFFHVPTTSEDVVPKIIATTVVSET